MAINSLLDENYPEIFCRYIMRNAEYALECVQEATTSLSTDEQELGMHTLSFTLKLAEVWPVTRDLLLAMAPKMEQAGYRDTWIVYLESGLEQSQKVRRAGMPVGDMKSEGELRLYLGELYQYLTQYKNARCQFECSLTYFEKVGDLPNQVRALSSLANVMRCQSNFNKAKQLVETALGLLEQQDTEQQANCYRVLGVIAFDQHNWSDAYNFLSKSLVLWEEVKNQRMIAWGLTNLGVVLWQIGKHEDAIDHYKKAINQFELIQDPVHLALARMNLGNVYIELDRFEFALELYLLAQPIFRKTQDKLRLAMLNNNKGMAYQKLQQLDKAAQAYLLSIDLWQQIGHVGSLVNVIDNLGLVYLEQQRYDKAIATFQDGLNWLAQIRDDPSYNFLFDMVTTHLRDAIEHEPQ